METKQKTIFDAYKEGEFTLSEYDKIKYNAEDHPDFLRGENAKKQKVSSRIYSVYMIGKDGYAKCQSRDVWGGIWDETFHASTLIPYQPNK